jgi:hypothetical protein
MGFMFVMGFCIACHTPISFNPHTVPSLRVNGTREPLCRGCANKWNKLHPENARPIAADAYEAAEV